MRLRTALRTLFGALVPNAVLTAQQDILLCDIREEDRDEVVRILRAHGVTLVEDLTPVARWALACPALPTCGLALSEAERVQAPMVGAIEAALGRHGLLGETISVRITGCPNGCARPYAGDIGIVGRAPGLYTLYVGGDFEGTRLNVKLVDKVREDDVAGTLDPLFAAWAASRKDAAEGFGDWCHRVGPAALASVLRARVAA
jgi:sulfite reductase (ferredoxin)